MIRRSCTLFAFELEPRMKKNCDVFTHSYDFCIVTTRNYDFFLVVMRNCVAVFRNYGSQCDRSYVVTASQFDRNETHGCSRTLMESITHKMTKYGLWVDPKLRRMVLSSKDDNSLRREWCGCLSVRMECRQCLFLKKERSIITDTLGRFSNMEIKLLEVIGRLNKVVPELIFINERNTDVKTISYLLSIRINSLQVVQIEIHLILSFGMNLLKRLIGWGSRRKILSSLSWNKR